MGLREPVVAFIAASNQEAQTITLLLNKIGVEAYVSEDNATMGEAFAGATNHRPRVYIEMEDRERAATVLAEFMKEEQLRKQRLENAPPISAECEDCGAVSEFPASQDGTVQDCPKCKAMIDVGTFEWPDEEED